MLITHMRTLCLSGMSFISNAEQGDGFIIDVDRLAEALLVCGRVTQGLHRHTQGFHCIQLRLRVCQSVHQVPLLPLGRVLPV